jgi:uncharacterized protein YaeQ
MAQASTVHVFTIDLADSDRGVYESLELRVARHPSESEEYLVARVLAYCLEYTEGIAFSKGLSGTDEPALTVRDAGGALRAWIEIGWPDAARLHRASKASPRVAVYTHRDPAQLVRNLAGERIHRVDELEIYAFDRAFIGELARRLERRNDFALSVAEGELHVSIGTSTVAGTVSRVSI